jgi:hypothetical protein
MTFTTHRSTIQTLKPGDRHFQIRDGLTVASRAGFEISSDCPYNHLQIIQTCIEKGWIKPVANISEREMVFIGLTDE